MVKNILITIICIFSLNVSAEISNSSDIEAMYKILKSKQLSQLIDYFSEDIELTIADDDFYGKTEADEAMNNFFVDKNIELFEIIHNGGDELEDYFIIGKLVVSGKVYRIHLLISKEDLSDKIVEMSIEED